MKLTATSPPSPLPLQPVSVGELVVKRLEATRRLQQDPSDISAQQTLCYIEKQVWILRS